MQEKEKALLFLLRLIEQENKLVFLFKQLIYVYSANLYLYNIISELTICCVLFKESFLY